MFQWKITYLICKTSGFEDKVPYCSVICNWLVSIRVIINSQRFDCHYIRPGCICIWKSGSYFLKWRMLKWRLGIPFKQSSSTLRNYRVQATDTNIRLAYSDSQTQSQRFGPFRQPECFPSSAGKVREQMQAGFRKERV